MKGIAARSLVVLLALVVLAPDAGAAVYELVPGDSQMRILVYRAGPLARLGHNHVVTATRIRGEVDYRPEAPLETTFTLRVPVNGLAVDDPAQRQALGPPFDTSVDPDDARATRANMLGSKVLDAQRYPQVQVDSQGVSGSAPEFQVKVRIQIRGVQQTLEVPVQTRLRGERLRVSGSVPLRQTDFGIEPLRIAFGAIAVRDQVQVQFDLTAARRGTP